MGEKGYKKLIVWQKADELAYQIYLETNKFPRSELFGITSQIRRSALSIPTNLVEGCSRQGKKEIKQYANIALGSLGETEYLLGFSFKLGYLDRVVYEKLEAMRQEVGNLLWKFYLSFDR
jgi:four helix bundle protein